MTALPHQHRNIALLAGAQALFQTAVVIVATLSGLVGYALASDKALATLPLGMMIVSAAAMLLPAALLMRRYGRRLGFMAGTLLGIASGAVAVAAIWMQSFWLFVGANMLVGAYQGFAQYYRFAAAEAASEDMKSRALSWVLAGGVVAALAGPTIAKYTHLLGPWPYAMSYLALTLLSLLALLLVAALALPEAEPVGTAELPRPLAIVMTQATFLTAVAASAIGSAAMVLVMTATPIAMKHGGHADAASATVIQWHMLGMYIPSFFTGSWIRRFGVLPVMGAGVALFCVHVVIALNGTGFLHFVSGLVLVGLGWNLLFVGGSTLLSQTWRAAERSRVQALHDLLMLVAMSAASFSAGGLLEAWGWAAVNLAVLPLLGLVALAMLWLWRQQRGMVPRFT